MVNTKMFEFKHPKYYTELRKRNKALRSCDAYSKENSNYTERQQSDQAISLRAHDGERERASDPGHKPQAASSKPQATRTQLETNCSSDKNPNPQASSDKLQAPSRKHQAPSRKRQAP